ncbi:MAG: homoserine O-acetyltransferase [Wenzhouxiangella sp.]|jgi:homoserine O-acetyltransferase|nr:homoserine O-acetyltransferase [Wenzhouxiangella sp.]
MSNSRVHQRQLLRFDHPPSLDGGLAIDGLQIGYRTWGQLNRAGNNAVLVCPALTGNADVDQWWSGLLGAGKALDPEREFIIAADVLGGCGLTSGSGAHTGGDPFPSVTVRAMVDAQRLLLDHLGIRTLRLVIGGSLGGMQALEWAVGHPERVDAAAVIAAPARQTAWARAFNHIQRRALELDDSLDLARMVAMISYRHWDNLNPRFDAADPDDPTGAWLDHHGRALTERFDRNAYLRLAEAMDTHDVGRGRGDTVQALRSTEVPTLLVGITTDLLYPPAELEAIAAEMPDAELEILEAPQGHDAFLIEQETLNELVTNFRCRRRLPYRLSCCGA